MSGLNRDNNVPWKSILGMGTQRSVAPHVELGAPVGGHPHQYATLDLETAISKELKLQGLYLYSWQTRNKIRYCVSSHNVKAKKHRLQADIVWSDECPEATSRNSQNYRLLQQIVTRFKLNVVHGNKGDKA